MSSPFELARTRWINLAPARRNVADAQAQGRLPLRPLPAPFWVMVDLFFDSADSYAEHQPDPAISAESIAAIYGVDAAHVKRFEVKSLNMVKTSYPRTTPQGGVVERDMHSGQQFVPLLELQLRRNR